MKLVFSFCIALLTCSPVWSNGTPRPTRTVEGTIVDAANGELLTGVRVLAQGATQVVFTDESGHFAIEVPADGQALLEFQLVSFQNVVLEVLVEAQPIQVALVEQP